MTETVTTSSATSAIQFSHDADGLQICASPTSCPGGAGALTSNYDPLLPRPETSASGVVTDTTTYNAYGELATYEAFASGTPIFSEIVDTAGSPRDELGRIVDRTKTNAPPPSPTATSTTCKVGSSRSTRMAAWRSRSRMTTTATG